MALPADSDRDRAAASLRRHYLRGRLSVEELSDRLDQAFGARSDHEIRGALRDLPAPWHRSELPELAATAGHVAKRTVQFAGLAALWCFLSMLLLIAFVVVVATNGSGVEAAGVLVIWLGATWVVRHAWRSGASR
jgi:hypothetical protein